MIEDLAKANQDREREFNDLRLALEGTHIDQKRPVATPKPSPTFGTSLVALPQMKSQGAENPAARKGQFLGFTNPSAYDVPPVTGPAVRLLLDEFTKLHSRLLSEVRSPHYKIENESRARYESDITSRHTLEVQAACKSEQNDCNVSSTGYCTLQMPRTPSLGSLQKADAAVHADHVDQGRDAADAKLSPELSRFTQSETFAAGVISSSRPRQSSIVLGHPSLSYGPKITGMHAQEAPVSHNLEQGRVHSKESESVAELLSSSRKKKRKTLQAGADDHEDIDAAKVHQNMIVDPANASDPPPQFLCGQEDSFVPVPPPPRSPHFCDDASISIPFHDFQAPTRVPDAKRKRNAPASHRFGRLRKEMEQEAANNAAPSEQKAKNLVDERDPYRWNNDSSQDALIRDGPSLFLSSLSPAERREERHRNPRDSEMPNVRNEQFNSEAHTDQALQFEKRVTRQPLLGAKVSKEENQATSSAAMILASPSLPQENRIRYSPRPLFAQYSKPRGMKRCRPCKTEVAVQSARRVSVAQATSESSPQPKVRKTGKNIVEKAEKTSVIVENTSVNHNEGRNWDHPIFQANPPPARHSSGPQLPGSQQDNPTINNHHAFADLSVIPFHRQPDLPISNDHEAVAAYPSEFHSQRQQINTHQSTYASKLESQIRNHDPPIVSFLPQMQDHLYSSPGFAATNAGSPQPHLPGYMQGFTDPEQQMVANTAQNNAMNMTEEQRIQTAKRTESLPNHQKTALESGGFLQSEAARMFRQSRQRNALALQQQQQQHQHQQQQQHILASGATSAQLGFAGQNGLQQQANISQQKGMIPPQKAPRMAKSPLGMDVQQQGLIAFNGNINQQILAQQQEALRHQQAGHMVVPGNPGSGGNAGPGGNPGLGGDLESSSQRRSSLNEQVASQGQHPAVCALDELRPSKDTLTVDSLISKWTNLASSFPELLSPV